jgi:class 3 adenylate cyclase
MADQRAQRRLAAILAVDETGTLAALGAHRAELIHPTIAEHGGRIVKLMGDGTLAEFASVVDAVDLRAATPPIASPRSRASGSASLPCPRTTRHQAWC